MKTCKYCKNKSVEKQNDYYVCTLCGKINNTITNLQNEMEFEYTIPNTSLYSANKQYLSSDLSKKQTYIKDYPEIKKVCKIYPFITNFNL